MCCQRCVAAGTCWRIRDRQRRRLRNSSWHRQERAADAVLFSPSLGRHPVTVLAKRKNALAAAKSRCLLSMTPTRAPSRSIARYRYRHWPRTLMYVSSIYQLRPTRPLRLRRRFSARAGVSFASHSRTASLVAQEPGHYEGNDVARVLCLIQHAGAAFVELRTGSGTGGNLVPSAQVVRGSRLIHTAAHLASLPPNGGQCATLTVWRNY